MREWLIKGHVNINVDQTLVEVAKTSSSSLWNGECRGNLDSLVIGSMELGTPEPTAIKTEGLLSEN